MEAFVTEEMVRKAIDLATPTIQSMMREGVVNKSDLAVVVSVRQADGTWEEAGTSSFGDRERWEYAYDEIARGKDAITRRTGLSAQDVQVRKP